MHASTIDLLRRQIRQKRASIEHFEALLVGATDPHVVPHVEHSIRSLREMLAMHLRTERTLRRNQRIAETWSPLDDDHLARPEWRV